MISNTWLLKKVHTQIYTTCRSYMLTITVSLHLNCFFVAFIRSPILIDLQIFIQLLCNSRFSWISLEIRFFCILWNWPWLIMQFLGDFFEQLKCTNNVISVLSFWCNHYENWHDWVHDMFLILIIEIYETLYLNEYFSEELFLMMINNWK